MVAIVLEPFFDKSLKIKEIKYRELKKIHVLYCNIAIGIDIYIYI